MAIKKTIEFTVETKKAQVNLKELGNTIQEQKDITIQFERELSDLEAQLESTSSANIGKQKALRTRVTDLKSALKDQRLTLKELNNEKTKANKITDISTKTLSQNYGVVQLLDQVTGGLASQVRSVVDANRLFNISLKGTRKALIATGIGAFVVALGAVVAYWDEISDFIEGTTKKLERQVEAYKRISEQLDHQLKLNKIDQQIATAKGKSTDELIKKERKLLIIRQANTVKLVSALEAQLAIEQSKIREVTLLEKGLIALKAYVFGYQTVGESVVGALGFDTLSKIKGELDDLAETAKQTELAIAKIDNPEGEKKGDPRPKNLEGVNAIEKTAGVQRLDSAKALEDTVTGIALRGADARILVAEHEARTKEEIRDLQLNNVANGIGLLASLDKDSKALQASAIIAEGAVGIAKTVISTQASNAIVIAEGAALAIPSGGSSVLAASKLVLANNISSGISIAAMVAATGKGLSALGGGGGGRGAGGGSSSGGGARAPEFNLVKGTASNQIAESIQGQDQPIKAFVVSSDVTSSQELSRNIEGDSSL